MLTLLRNAHLYSPEDEGIKDVLIGAGKILHVGTQLPAIPDGLGPSQEINLTGKKLVPGFVDSHVHFTGGGGNESYASRIPDLQVSDLTLGGITTAVTCLGVDTIAKTLDSMLMKARALDDEGITTFIYAGSFVFGSPTFFGDLRQDLALIDKVVGIKIAIAESRGTHPTELELARLASDAFVGGLLSGKAGCLNIHLGLKPEDPYPLLAAGLDISGVPPDRFVVGHVNYSASLLEGAIAFKDHGTFINVDTILTQKRDVEPAVEPHLAILKLLEAGVPAERLGMCTDGNASVPRRRPDGVGRKPYQLGFDSLSEELRLLVSVGVDLSTALTTITTTPASMIGMQSVKGGIRPGMDADLVTLSDDLYIRDVWAKGVRHVKDGAALITGMYENEEVLS